MNMPIKSRVGGIKQAALRGMVPQRRLELIKEKFLRIRANGVRRNLSAIHRESLAREFLARSVVVPELKKIFPKGLKAIILPGSAQVGVRKSNTQRRGSDIDITVVVAMDTFSTKKGPKFEMFDLGSFYMGLEELELKFEHTFGVELNIAFQPSESFHINEFASHHSDVRPFTVLYGDKWLQSVLGKEHFAKFPAARERMKNDPKYLSNNKIPKDFWMR